ncbi:MAG: substrate-binding periplasmic protein [Rhodoferax sp.]
MRAVVFALWLLMAATWAGAQQVLVIAGIPEKPLRWIGEDGSPRGFDVDVIAQVMKRMGQAYRIELVDSSARLERNARARPSVYDMVFTFSHTPEREEFLLYPQQSHISIHWNFFVLRENAQRFHFERFEDLASATIGVTQGFSYTDAFWRAVRTVPLRVDEVVSNKLQLDKLLARRFDLVPLNTQATLYEARERGLLHRISYLPKPLKVQPYFNTFVRGAALARHPELARRYDEALRQMRRDGTLERLRQAYAMAD